MTDSVNIVHWNCQGFNAHGPEYIWSLSKQNDTKGNHLYNHVIENNIVILNDGTGTRLNPINLETSSLI